MIVMWKDPLLAISLIKFFFKIWEDEECMDSEDIIKNCERLKCFQLNQNY